MIDKLSRQIDDSILNRQHRRPAKLFGEGFSEEAQQLTTLTKYLELETWTPLVASLLVCGIQPPQGCTEIPKGAMGLDNAFLMDSQDPFHDARRILEIWNSRENAPAKVRPADFVAWCKTKKINTDWLRDVPIATPPVVAIAEAAPVATPEPPAPPLVAVGASGGVEPDKATPVQNTATRPKFSMTKAALITAHQHEWPTIQRDIADAKTNGLAAAKAGVRGWNEADALLWARAKGKLKSAVTPASLLAQTMHSMASIPGCKHKL